MIGDVITQVIAAIQPLVFKSVTTAVTAAVATAFKQMREELQTVETMKGETCRESEGEHGAIASEITDTTFRPRQTGAVAARTVSEFTTYPNQMTKEKRTI